MSDIQECHRNLTRPLLAGVTRSETVKNVTGMLQNLKKVTPAAHPGITTFSPAHSGSVLLPES